VTARGGITSLATAGTSSACQSWLQPWRTHLGSPDMPEQPDMSRKKLLVVRRCSNANDEFLDVFSPAADLSVILRESG
jgi:hypothetical protein